MRDDGDRPTDGQDAVPEKHMLVPEGKELASQKHLLFAMCPL